MSEKYKRLIDFIEARYGDIGYTLDDERHSEVALAAIKTINDIFPLKDKWVLDVGCGNGRDIKVFEEEFDAHALGITMEKDDPTNNDIVGSCDMSFLEYSQVYSHEYWDVVFARHVLEHSLFPYFTLTEFNRVMKMNGLLYIEVPAPAQKCNHEYNHNHYSVFGPEMWRSLLARTGFKFVLERDLRFVDHHNEVVDTWLIFIYEKVAEPAKPWHAKEMNEVPPDWIL